MLMLVLPHQLHCLIDPCSIQKPNLMYWGLEIFVVRFLNRTYLKLIFYGISTSVQFGFKVSPSIVLPQTFPTMLFGIVAFVDYSLLFFFSCQEKSNLADEWSRSFPEHWDHVGSAFSQATTRFLPFSAPDGLPDYHPDSLWSSRQIEWPLSLVPSRFHPWRLPVGPFCCLHPTSSLARHDTVAGPFVPAVMFGDYSLVYVSPFAFRSLRCN